MSSPSTADLPAAKRFALPPFVAPLIVVAVAVLLQLTIKPIFHDYIETVMIDAGIAVVMAVSLNIVNGYTGQFSIGHAAFYALGGYTAAGISYYASIYLFDTAAVQSGWAYVGQTALFIGATLMGGIVAAATGWIVGLPSLRLKGDYLAIVTLGFGEIVRILLQQTNDQLPRNPPPGAYSPREVIAAELQDNRWSKLLPPPVGGSLGFINTPKMTNIFWTALLVGLTILVAWRLKKSSFGRSMIAIRENEIAAESMGVNVTRLKVWAFVIAAFFAGAAGSVYAHKLGTTIGPKDAGFVESFNIIIMVVLGGLGSISGAALAAVLFVVAQQWLIEPTHIWHIGLGVLVIRLIIWPEQRVRAVIWGACLIALGEGLWWLQYALTQHGYTFKLGDYRIILFALILIIVMIQRPGGLFGTHEITDLARMRRRGDKEVAT